MGEVRVYVFNGWKMMAMGHSHFHPLVATLSQKKAIKYGTIGLVAGGAGTVLASTYNTSFHKYMSISAKTSIPVMVGVFLFSLKYELTLSSAQRYPEEWGLSDEFIKERKVSHLPVHHRIMNTLYDHPFLFITCTGGPFAAFVLRQQMQIQHLTISQRVMHSRVIAQAGIISLAMTTMAFREYMDRRGRFPEPDE
jgi:hypothetical protein